MKRHAPATGRNSAPIADVLRRELPDEGLVLEIASGTGEHAVFFAREFPQITWLPTDREASELASIAAWTEDAGVGNIAEPVVLDASAHDWPVIGADAIVCINMIHISPWEATEGLMRGAGRLLDSGAPLVLYGPYREAGVETALSNEQFELWLKDRDPRFGLRNIEDVDALAARHGLARTARHEMPANNLTLVYRKR
ncbi:DUF938 domain-containing protein [Qipengyuania oceanensis]|uniref:DUF938 domain-containing protein n=1 Tax=Qipengyuania oceanensis TaxID=1463597 RepID=A0A844YJM6_9SPHN|nr:DUF938 domain-containing protein [Qipengyuania oceanensis]MXO63519.1 DUF938 domain-containing protein [Qipengyuania oceanensis]